ncbi:MAG: potassium channel family protein [Candidatus Acidiferrales bacterium]
MTLPAVIGLIIIAAILWEAFETVVLPRRVMRRLRLTVLFYRLTWIPWRAIARGLQKAKKRESFLSYYGPLSLLFLFVFWAIALIVGFGLLYYSSSTADSTHPTFLKCLYLSGTTFFTLGIGDVLPHTTVERILAVVESGLGFGFLALVLSYLPVIYQAFSRREVNIVLLDARAGSPPTATELLLRHSGPSGLEELQQLFHEWERWSAEILESHVSYPVVSYFRSQHNNESWLGALAAILDACALLIACFEDAGSRQARLTFAICRHTVVDLAQVFYAAPRSPAADRLSSAELRRMHAALAKAGWRLSDTSAANAKLAELREMYEPYLQALAAHLFVELPPWILATEITDNWRTSAWGRISGFKAILDKNPALDDHSD